VKLLVTGVNGFLGIHTAVAALQTGAELFGLDLPASFSRGARARSTLTDRATVPEAADLSDPDNWREALQRIEPEIIMHLAGLISRGKSGDPSPNFTTTSAMLDAIRLLPLKERPVVVYPGSQLEYGAAPMPWTERTICRPAGPYADSKLRATELLLAANAAGECRAGVLRFPIVYGPCQAPSMFIPELISQALAGAAFKMTAGRQRRRFIYVADAASLLLKYGAGLHEGAELPPLLNAPASQPMSMRRLAEKIVDLIGGDITLEIGAIPMRDSEVLDQWPDDSLAAALSFACETGLEEGLTRTVAWYRENGWFLQRDL